jgi:hypothetical protein
VIQVIQVAASPTEITGSTADMDGNGWKWIIYWKYMEKCSMIEAFPSFS